MYSKIKIFKQDNLAAFLHSVCYNAILLDNMISSNIVWTKKLDTNLYLNWVFSTGDYYLLQTKVMFLHLSVSHSVHGEGEVSMKETRLNKDSTRQKPPRQRPPPLGRDPLDRDPLYDKERAVPILLECILVIKLNKYYQSSEMVNWQQKFSNCSNPNLNRKLTS